MSKKHKDSKKETHHNHSHHGAGFLAGVVAGAALGVLFAPVDGKKARKVVDKKTKKLRKEAGDVLDKAKKSPSFAEVIDTVEKTVNEISSAITEKSPINGTKKTTTKKTVKKSPVKKTAAKKASPSKSKKAPVKKTAKKKTRTFKGV